VPVRQRGRVETSAIDEFFVGIVPKIFAAMSELTSCDVFTKELRIVRKCFLGVKSLEENNSGKVEPVKESSEKVVRTSS
jgi:hypothetical protein